MAEVDDEGRYTGRMAFYAYGPDKAEAMVELAARTGIDLAASTAYSDSATDLPMLEAVGHPVAVNPDRALAKVAREREWEMRQFTKPVRLRDRMTRAHARWSPPAWPSPWRWRCCGGGAAGARAAGRAADGPRAGPRRRLAGLRRPPGGPGLRSRAAAWRRRRRG